MKLKDVLDRLVKAQGDGDFIENSNAEMQELLGVSHNTCDKYMRELTEVGLITRATCHGKVVRTRVGAGVLSAPLCVRDAMIAGRLDLALSMVLSDLVYHNESPGGEETDKWKSARPEWLVFAPRFKELLTRYEYDRMAQGMIHALWHDECDGDGAFRDANVYVDGVCDGEILAPEILIENVCRNMGKFIASMDANAIETAEYYRSHDRVGYDYTLQPSVPIYLCVLPCTEGHIQATPEQVRNRYR